MFIKSDKGIDQSGRFKINGESFKINSSTIFDRTIKFVEVDRIVEIVDFNKKNFKCAKIIKYKNKYYYCHIFKINNIYRIGRIYKIYRENKNNNKNK